MFAPPGYVALGAIAERLPYEVGEYFFPDDSLQFFEFWDDDSLVLPESTDWQNIDWMNDWVFRNGVVWNWVIHRILLTVPLYVCSTSGTILQLGRYAIERTWTDETATDAELLRFDPRTSPFEKQRFVYLTSRDSYKFIDVESGLIRLSVDDDLDDNQRRNISYSRADNAMIKNFLGWSVCFSATDIPKDAVGFLDFIGNNKNMQVSCNAASKRGRGRPSQRETVVRVYCSAFPSGHQREGKTWKEALQMVNKHLTSPIAEDTLRRALGPNVQNR